MGNKKKQQLEREREGGMPELVTIFYDGKPLWLPLTESHMVQAVARLMWHLNECIGRVTVNGFPDDWALDPLPKRISKPALKLEPHMETSFDEVEGLKQKVLEPVERRREKPPKLVLREFTAAEVIDIIKKYNIVAKPFAQAWAGSYNNQNLFDWGDVTCSGEVAEAITMLAYEMAVPRPKELNAYQSWSAKTYGETNLAQMQSLLVEVQITNKDVFLDIGAGVGHLVMFTAAFAKCKKSIGIEIADKPYEYSLVLEEKFKLMMSYFGKRYGKFELIKGDVMDETFKKLIQSATVIFINNLLFPEEMMCKLKMNVLQLLQNGTRIITTKCLSNPKKTTINRRSIGDISAIADTVKLHSLPDGVSWTGAPVTFYLTTINQGKLQKYFDKENPEKKAAAPQPSKEKASKAKPKQQQQQRGQKRRRISETSFSECSSSTRFTATSSSADSTFDVEEQQPCSSSSIKRARRGRPPHRAPDDNDDEDDVKPSEKELLKTPVVKKKKKKESSEVVTKPSLKEVKKEIEEGEPSEVVTSGPLVLLEPLEDVKIEVESPRPRPEKPHLMVPTPELGELILQKSIIHDAVTMQKIRERFAKDSKDEGDVRDSIMEMVRKVEEQQEQKE